MSPPEGVVPPPGPGSLAEALRDRYVLEREIAPGRMATVYLGSEVAGETTWQP